MKKLMDMFSLEGKVAVITGGAGVLGIQHGISLTEAGAKVILLDRAEEAGHKAVERISHETGHQAVFMPVDLADSASIKKVFDDTVEQFGSVDILVNNAAMQSENFFESFETFPLDDWRQVMSVNIDAMFLCAQQAGKIMKANGKGSIINIASIYGIVAPDPSIYEGSEYKGKTINTPAVYSVSKGGVVMLTKYLAAYWGKDGIRTNCVTPGGIFTGQNDAFIKKYSKKCPMGRMGNQEELKGAIVFLASDASSYVNGHNLVVDGGWSIW